MQITINSPEIDRHTGYGRASYELQKALEARGIQVVDDADVVVNFCMPPAYKYRDITIGYTPWESTKIPESWRDGLSRIDDLWTTSTWNAQLFKNLVGRDCFILPHGLNNNWVPEQHKRDINKPFTFLHVGEPAVRKGGDIVLNAFYRAFRRENVRLIYKSTGQPMARVKDRSGSIIYSPGHLIGEGLGEVIAVVYTDEEMVDLYRQVDCMVYPTRGEGFGLIPLEAMSTGLPTIVTGGGGTADFSKYGVELTSFLWMASNEPEHPGLWIDHDVEEVIEKMRYVMQNYAIVSEQALVSSSHLRSIYSWEKISEKAASRLDKLIHNR